MNLYNLKIFTDTAKLGSMSKAADLNNLSRPAVSHAIKRLEIELGVELLVHQRRFIELTNTGRFLLKKAEVILGEAENLALQLREGKEPLIRDIKIGSARTLATYNLPPIIAKMTEIYPEISFQVQMATSSILVQKLENREVDLVVMIGDESPANAKQTVLARGHFVLVKPHNKKEESLKYALTELRPETERLKVLYERTFEKSLPIFAEIHSWDAIWYAVGQGLCGGLVPDFLLSLDPRRNKTSYDILIPKVFPYEIKAMYLNSKSNDEIIKNFITSLKTSSIIGPKP